MEMTKILFMIGTAILAGGGSHQVWATNSGHMTGFFYPANCTQYWQDPEVVHALDLASHAMAAVYVYASAIVTANASVVLATQAQAQASTVASSLANVDISNKNTCIASTASASSMALARACSSASSAAKAAASAYGTAAALSAAAAMAVANVSAKLCVCQNTPRLQLAVLQTSNASETLHKSVRKYAQVARTYATTLAAAQSVSSSLTSATGKLCSYCGKGFQEIDLNLGSLDKKNDASGSIHCSDVLHQQGFC